MSERVLLIDGDMVAYRIATAEEKTVSFDDSFILTADAESGRANIDLTLEHFKSTLKADRLILAFTAKDNYRKDVMPSYKANRDGIRRPMILGALREYCEGAYETVVRPRLEADDVLGIMATNPKILPDAEKIIVTWDKDLRTVPGLHWNPEHDANSGPVEVSQREADDLFYAQILSGDAVDGYPGCPGIGKKRASDIVTSRTQVYPHEEVIQRGANKGNVRVTWKTIKNPDPWTCIVSHYEKAGLTEADALQTAQVARILRHGEFNYKKQEPILWTPNAH